MGGGGAIFWPPVQILSRWLHSFSLGVWKVFIFLEELSRSLVLIREGIFLVSQDCKGIRKFEKRLRM